MARNGQKHLCSCCGKRGHTIAKCDLPGAKKIMALAKEIRVLKHITKKSRINQRVRRKPASFRQLLQKRSAQYSGPGAKARCAAAKNMRRAKDPTAIVQFRGPLQCHEELVRSGFLHPPPRKCPVCNSGFLALPSTCPSRSDEDQLYCRCENHDCKSYLNVLKFSMFFENWQRIRGISCSQLLNILKSYTNPAGNGAPRAATAAKMSGVNTQTVQHIFDILRQKECELGHAECGALMLGGDVETQRNIEGDGTVLRKLHVGNENPAFAQELAVARAAWKTKHGSSPRPPKRWTVHVRYAALVERGGGLVVCVPLPCKVIAPNGPPPPEAFDELKDSGLLDHLSKGSFLFCDGAHSWPKLVKWYNAQRKTRFTLREVAHYKGEYTRFVKSAMKKQSHLSGTQAIDSRWRWLKQYVPFNLKGRANRSKNPALDTYVFSWVWRCNRKSKSESIWDSLGHAFRM
jgi:hypothetical protein